MTLTARFYKSIHMYALASLSFQIDLVLLFLRNRVYPSISSKYDIFSIAVDLFLFFILSHLRLSKLKDGYKLMKRRVSDLNFHA